MQTAWTVGYPDGSYWIHEGDIMLHPYPAELPAELWTMLLDAWRGNFPDKIEVAHAAWHAGGFALSKFDKNHPIFASGPLLPVSQEEGERVLSEGLAAAKSPLAAAPAGFPWITVLSIVIEIIRRLST